MRQLSLIMLISSMLTACSSVAPYQAPSVNLPPQWSTHATAGLSEGAWWQALGSQHLPALLQQAQAANLNLAAAQARVQQAQALLKAAHGGLQPSVDFNINTQHTLTQGGQQQRSYKTGFTVSYALDLNGAQQAAIVSAEQQLAAQLYAQAATQLQIQAETANAYLQLLALQQQLELAQTNRTTAQEILRKVESKARLGADSALTVAQQRSSVASIEAEIPNLRQQLDTTRHALALLLGKTPAQLPALTDERLSDLQLPALAIGQPAELLRRRPDVLQAEALLRQANAEIGAAKAALLPSINLSLSAVLSGSRLAVLDPSAALASALLAPLTSGGQLEAKVEQAQAGYSEQLANYQQAVLTAVQEVEDALSGWRYQALRRQSLEQAAGYAEQALQLAQARYSAGAEDYLTVLEAQRSQLSSQSSAVSARLSEYQAAVELFYALGGGWR